MKISYDGELCFGQHKRKNVSQVDAQYLEWMLETITTLSPSERHTVQMELCRREMGGESAGYAGSSSGSNGSNGSNGSGNQYRTAPNRPAPRIPVGVTSQTILEVISAGRQTLAKRYHPDLGGDAQKMLAVNVTADYLEAQAQELTGAAR